MLTGSSSSKLMTSAILQLAGGIGVGCVIDAVGVDAVRAAHGRAGEKEKDPQQAFDAEVKEIAPQAKPDGDNWRSGGGPSQVLSWAVRAVAKAGTVSIIGVYPQTDRTFPIGEAMNRNLVLCMGNCNHRAITPHLVEVVRNGSWIHSAC
jgi:threonine dehydrogenase-like Zn-dependent dehydrogenase